MKEFDLKIYSSNKVFYDGKATSLILPTPDGSLGVLANHENMVVALDIGELHIKYKNQPWITAAVGKGFAEIINNKVSVLSSTVETPDEIDENRAREAKERAEEQLRQHKSMREYYATQADLARAMSRLKASKSKNWNI